MATILELSAQYRKCGIECKYALCMMKQKLENKEFDDMDEVEVRRRITMLTAMSRDCIATSNYLKKYSERRMKLEQRRRKRT